ncbi:PREDICTED: uncharacterized protein LOC101307781 [Fragaria vesca subsp. vesca]
MDNGDQRPTCRAHCHPHLATSIILVYLRRLPCRAQSTLLQPHPSHSTQSQIFLPQIELPGLISPVGQSDGDPLPAVADSLPATVVLSSPVGPSPADLPHIEPPPSIPISSTDTTSPVVPTIQYSRRRPQQSSPDSAAVIHPPVTASTAAHPSQPHDQSVTPSNISTPSDAAPPPTRLREGIVQPRQRTDGTVRPKMELYKSWKWNTVTSRTLAIG